MALFVLAFLFGCPRSPDCTTSAAASVVLTVVDSDGAPVLGADVTWEQAGGERAPCDALSDGAYVCGYEVAGEIALHVEADGFRPWDGSADVLSDDDGCHVIGVEVTASLEADLPCGDDVREPSVRATVVSSDGEALTGVLVTWGGEEPVDCDPSGDFWWCDPPVGEAEITATADGHEAAVQEITVTEDECGPISQDVVLTLIAVP